MQLKYNQEKNIFYTISTFQEKDIPKNAGFRWDPAAKIWITPDSKNALKLSGYADSNAKLALQQAIEKSNEAVQASKATNALIDIPCPENLSYLPFQKAGIEFGKDKDSVLLADEMGLGKTIQALGLLNLHPEISKILIICPASLKINWYRECQKWLIKPYKIEILYPDSKYQENTNIFIINYNILNKLSWLNTITWDVLIGDEIHYAKNYKAQRSKTVYEIAKNAKRKLFLTGTPIVNRPSELYGIISALGFRMKWIDYVKKYCNAYQTRYGWDVSGASNLDELQQNLREKFMVRRLKKDVLTELPAKRRQIIEIAANGLSKQIEKESQYFQEVENKKAELKAKKDLAKANENEEDYKKAIQELRDFGQTSFTEISKLRHETALAKIPYAIDHITEMLENTNKIVIFAHHHDVIDALAQVNVPHVILTGQSSQEDRQKAVDEFQNNPDIKLFIGSITAAGVGITLTASSTVIFIELDWVPGNMSQAEDRCHRIGQHDSVLIQHLIIDGSIDSKLAKTLIEKQKIIDQALDQNIESKSLTFNTEDIKTIENNISEIQTFQVPEFTDEEKSDILIAIKEVAQYCDGARQKDGFGFNKYDAIIGKSLSSGIYTNKQANLGKQIIKKYKRQINENLYNKIFKGE